MSAVPRARAGALVVCIFALLLAGCGSQSSKRLPAGNRIRGDHLSLYVSVPRYGPSAVSGRAVVRAARIALHAAGHQIGRYHVGLRVVNDAARGTLPNTGEWNAGQTLAAAQKAARNPRTIGYIGDLDSGASAISIPVLNRLGIAQISPWSSAVGLTSSGIGSSPGEPLAYYPTTLRTFARVVPSDLIQAEAQVKLQRQLGCHATYVLDDGEYDGEAIAQAFDDVAKERRLHVVMTQSYLPNAPSYLSVGRAVAKSHANCVLLAAITARNAPLLAQAVAARARHARLFGTAGLAESSFTDPGEGGIPLKLDHRILITAAGGDPRAGYPQAGAFSRVYSRSYGPPPPVAVDAYEATNLMLSAIRSATDGGRRQAQRVNVVHALFGGGERTGPLGTYRIERNGNTSLSSYGVYRVQAGRLTFWRSIAT